MQQVPVSQKIVLTVDPAGMLIRMENISELFWLSSDLRCLGQAKQNHG